MKMSSWQISSGQMSGGLTSNGQMSREQVCGVNFQGEIPGDKSPGTYILGANILDVLGGKFPGADVWVENILEGKFSRVQMSRWQLS